ncbi:MAG: molybdopterin dinucleotide binding domain-containing protein [Bacteroidota bacterium]
MKMTRRDLIRFAAGSAAGLLFTPVPWKLLDDSAIWTQNWPWIPEPARGESTLKFSACTLCGAGCGIRARCVNGTPVHLSGIEGHALGSGYLCAAGLAAHHLAFHPLRVRQPLRRSYRQRVLESSPVSLEEAVATITRSIGPESVVAVLDSRPGRSVSRFYRKWLGSLRNGWYLTPPQTENGTLEALRDLVRGRPELGYDFEHAGTIVSFGTPLFDGWGSPGRMMHILDARARTGSPAVIQVEPRFSRSAMLADTWIPIIPGTETTLALALLDVIRQEKLASPANLRTAFTILSPGNQSENETALQAFSSNHAGRVTGMPAENIVAIARTMAAKSPTIVVGGGDAAAGPLKQATRQAIAALNIALGAVGATGGVVPRAPLPWMAADQASPLRHSSLMGVPDHSIDLLILDSSEDGCAIPWQAVERKLRNEKALVVSFSPFLSGLARHADIIIPSPAPLEQWEEIPTPFDAPRSSFSLSAPLMAPPEGTTDAVRVIQQLSLGTGGGLDGRAHLEAIKSRVAEILELRRGVVLRENTSTPAQDVPTPEALLDLLSSGGVWVDEAGPSTAVVAPDQGHAVDTFEATVEESNLQRLITDKKSVLLVPFGSKAIAGTGQVSPILSKLFQESKLRPTGSIVFVNPSTCDGNGLHDGDKVKITTGGGTLAAIVHADPTVIPGAAYYPVGPDPESINQVPRVPSSMLALCVEDPAAWRITKATLEKA